MTVYVYEKVAFIPLTNGTSIDGQNQAIRGIEHYTYTNVVSVIKDDVHDTWNITLEDESVIMHSQANYRISVLSD